MNLNSHAGAVGAAGLVGEAAVEMKVSQGIVVQRDIGSQIACGRVFIIGALTIVNECIADFIGLFQASEYPAMFQFASSREGQTVIDF
ncbi:MAG: hypothetical protein HOA32_14800 [Nitrospina sp.]|nr:hypothetical protein [Nitrospina sp.]MBT4048124.1 hypothetical protein [Nitrospina sp.]MBT4559170.1 hypothetical protein [Nitrospina sp.]MBT5347736.1 hypothetical protein [Nitrospina sp.]MBT5652657.1 hypothetical protein [Nitrospina sp.]